MKRILIISLIVFVLVGCTNKSKDYTVKLYGNTNSENIWSYEIEDNTIVGIDEEKYSGAENDNKESYLGGIYTFKVISKKQGETTIRFNYGKSWEKNYKYHYEVKLSVDNNKRITKVEESGNYLALNKVFENGKKLELDEDYTYEFEDDKKVDNQDCYILNIKTYDGTIYKNVAITKDLNKIYINNEGVYKIVK